MISNRPVERTQFNISMNHPRSKVSNSSHNGSWDSAKEVVQESTKSLFWIAFRGITGWVCTLIGMPQKAADQCTEHSKNTCGKTVDTCIDDCIDKTCGIAEGVFNKSNETCSNCTKPFWQRLFNWC